MDAQTERYHKLLERFHEKFPRQQAPRLFSAPGRAEICGNHTDHQSGRVLAASINLDTIAAAAPNGSDTVRVYSDDFPPIVVNLSDLQPQSEENGTSSAFIRGIAATLSISGRKIGGFDAVMTSDVLLGSGLSSSAAFCVLVCLIFDRLFSVEPLSVIRYAQIAQTAENHYYGKMSGLMDQMASAVGGIVAIDFLHKDPDVKAIGYDFAAKGYTLAVVDTRGSHDGLEDAYCSIRIEMEQVAAYFGERNLRAVDPAAFLRAIPKLRGVVSDRAILRSMHFFDENARVATMVDALIGDDLPGFLNGIIQSGQSSWMLLQNIWHTPDQQPIALALALSRQMLSGDGAWRVHGGGFAGTILAFVPHGIYPDYAKYMNDVFDAEVCHPLNIRPVGAYELTLE